MHITASGAYAQSGRTFWLVRGWQVTSIPQTPIDPSGNVDRGGHCRLQSAWCQSLLCQGQIRGTCDLPTSCIYRASRASFQKDRVLIIDLSVRQGTRPLIEKSCMGSMHVITPRPRDASRPRCRNIDTRSRPDLTKPISTAQRSASRASKLLVCRDELISLSRPSVVGSFICTHGQYYYKGPGSLWARSWL